MTRLATLTGLAFFALGVLGVSSAAGPPRAGSLDPSFGSGGLVTYSQGSGSIPSVGAIAIQPDGRIVVAGAFGGFFEGRSSILRYLPNGSLDSSFGQGGVVEIPEGDAVDAVAVQPDGKIVAAGYRMYGPDVSGLGPNTEFMVARYNRNGSVDTSFGKHGLATTDVIPDRTREGYYIYEIANAVAILPGGKIVAAGTGQFGDADDGGSVFALARYTADGSLDPTFGHGGVARTSFTGGDALRGIIVLPSGKIVATGDGAGLGHGEETEAILLARYTRDGSLDPSFGTKGTVNTSSLIAGYGGPPALQGTHIVVAGSVLARFTADGRLDTTFGKHGFAKSWGGRARAVAAQADGKLLVATGKAVIRYLPDGRVDTSFGHGGVVEIGASALALQADGRILVGGGGNYSWTLARLFSQEPAAGAPLGWSASRGGAILTSSDFRTADGAGRVSRAFRLENPGLTKSGKLAVSLTGSPAFSITSDKCTGKSISENLSCWVGVRYAPGADGASDSATLRAIGEHGVATRLSLSGCSSGHSGHVYWASGDPWTSTGTVNKVWRGGGCVTTLAGGQRNPSRPAADGTHVYWGTADGKVEEVPVRGGPVTTIGRGGSVAADGTHVYWISGDSVKEAPAGGGPVTTLASGQNPGSLGVNGTYVYWRNGPNGDTVNGVPVGGGAVTTLASVPDAWSVAVDATHVYWVTGYHGGVYEVPIGGGPVTTLASGQQFPFALAVDATHVYWVSLGDWSSSHGWAYGTVEEVPVGGGTVTTLAVGQHEPASLAVDSKNVYWANTDGTVKEVPLGGGTVQTLARGQGYYLTVAVGP